VANTTPEERRVALVLRVLGAIDLCALVAVLLPHAAMEQISLAIGAGELPREPVVGYLARSASLMYALHGVGVLYVACDVLRYAGLIRWLAGLSVVHGLALIVIDWGEGLPLWWQLLEGPTYTLTSLVVFTLVGRIRTQ
jgi:hypothetical protein